MCDVIWLFLLSHQSRAFRMGFCINPCKSTPVRIDVLEIHASVDQCIKTTLKVLLNTWMKKANPNQTTLTGS